MKTKKMTVHFLSALAVAFFIFIAIASGNSEKPVENEGNKKALEAIRKEPKVLEAIITDANVLYVSVKSDGTKRNGYAIYLCQILRENNASCKWVKVVEAGTTNHPKADNAYGILLGESKCD